MNIADMESVDQATAEKLSAAGIQTTKDLLERAGPADSRAALARATGLDPEQLATIANRADLMRIRKLVEPFVLLLEAIDLASRDKLKAISPSELLRSMRRKNVELMLVRGIYPESDLAVWIDEAGRIPSLLQR